MAKTVKFNLICDGNPVRTVDDLRENFSIEDVLAYYDNRLLHRWLGVRGYTELLEKVEEISTNDSMEIIKSLIALFNVEVDIKKVEESVYILQYKQEREELFSIYQNNTTKTNAVIDDHQAGYTKLVDTIIDNAKDIAKIRAAVTEMIGNYYWILEKDHRNLFYKLYYKAPMALFVMLTHDETRRFYLPQMIEETEPPKDVSLDDFKETEEDAADGSFEAVEDAVDEEDDNDVKEAIEGSNEKITDVSQKYNDEEMTHLMSVKRDMYNLICELISEADTIIGDNLLSFAGITDGYWKDLEPSGKRYMIIDMKEGNFVRSSGKAREEFGYSDISNTFLILNGIDYKSNNAADKLLYMEV